MYYWYTIPILERMGWCVVERGGGSEGARAVFVRNSTATNESVFIAAT